MLHYTHGTLMRNLRVPSPLAMYRHVSCTSQHCTCAGDHIVITAHAPITVDYTKLRQIPVRQCEPRAPCLALLKVDNTMPKRADTDWSCLWAALLEGGQFCHVSASVDTPTQ